MLKIPIRNFLIVFFIVIPVSIIGSLVYQNYRSTFNEERWKKNEEQRVHMVDDFLEKHTIKNMKKDEIKKLLGTPTHADMLKGKDSILYYLGKDKDSKGTDGEWLLISFDKDEKVENYKIITK